MEYITVKDAAEKWRVSERMVRKYCEQGKLEGVIHAGNIWVIPAEAARPTDSKVVAEACHPLAKKVVYQKKKNNHFGIYEYIQVNLAYSSCRMASNRLTREQVIELYRTGKISVAFEPMKVDDIIEISNHFRCVKYMIDTVQEPLTIYYLRKMHQQLLRGTVADQDNSIQIGEIRCQKHKYGIAPTLIYKELGNLINTYEAIAPCTIKDILSFHVRFERIHPFEDGNGRVGRIIIIKECLRHGLDPFIIDDKRRMEYNRGIMAWEEKPSFLMKVVEQVQARFKREREVLDLLEYCRPEKGRGAR